MSASVLPVVACSIWMNTDGKPSVVRREYPQPRVPALAVPDVLWGDHDFVQSCWHRLDAICGQRDEGTEDASIHDMVSAIHAELRARAGVE